MATGIILAIILLNYFAYKKNKRVPFRIIDVILQTFFILISGFSIGMLSFIIAGTPLGYAAFYGILPGVFSALFLIKAPKKYGWFFKIELIIIPILLFISESKYFHNGNYKSDTVYHAHKIFNKVWNNLDNPKKAKQLLEKVKNPYNVDAIENEKSAVNFALLLDKKNINDTINRFKRYEYRRDEIGAIFKYLLINRDVSSKEFKIILGILKKNGFKDYYSCSPSNINEPHPFLSIIKAKKFNNVSVILDNTEIETYSFINFAQDIYQSNDLNFKKRMISKMLYKVNFNPYNNNQMILDNYAKLVLFLYKHDPDFNSYSHILETKENVINKCKYDDETLKKEFIEMYNLLGSNHKLIRLIPNDVIKSYLNN